MGPLGIDVSIGGSSFGIFRRMTEDIGKGKNISEDAKQ